jgi:replicative DNA helicase
MTNKDFDKLPEKTVGVAGLPKTTLDDLPSYYQTLGDGSRKLMGIETGIKEIDRATMGLSGVIVLGGIAGQGKTSLAIQIAYETCEKGTPIIFYSLEMPKRAIYTKILNRLSKVGYSDILLKGKPYLDPEAKEKDLMGGEVDYKNLFTKDEKDALKQAQDRLIKVGDRLYIRSRERDEAPINFKTLETEINLIKTKHQAERVLVVIDHLQVFTLEEKVTDQIQKESKLIDGFKGVSEKTDTPILLISQKNKQGFSSSGLESIKGSVDIVYLADIVMFLESEAESKEEAIFNNGYKKIKLVISKNRYNSPQSIDLVFDGKNSNFETT